MDLKKIKKAYFVGIKGVGMTALAQVFQGIGIEITGSDTAEKFFTDDVLQRLNISIIEGFNENNVPLDADIIVASAAYYNPENRSATNPETQMALREKIPILTYAQALGLLFKDKYGIAVAGCHGKSTTTAMLGVILEKANLDPTVVVGTQIVQWKSNARVGASKYLVVEADEYRNNFLNYWPQVLIITNIEYDHPDFFKNFEEYKKSFKELIERVPEDGFVIINNQDEVAADLVKNAKCKIFKFSLPKNRVDLKLPGQHNQFNAGSALAAASLLGVDENIARKALIDFNGISRRFEFKKEEKGIIFIDDYAHHPSEIRAALQAARERYPQNRIWAVFQPHTFSRTKSLLGEFAQSFKQADKVIVLDIYGSAREKTGDVHARDLVKQINDDKAAYIPTINETAIFLKKECRSGDIILMMGAGDVWQLSTIFEF